MRLVRACPGRYFRSIQKWQSSFIVQIQLSFIIRLHLFVEISVARILHTEHKYRPIGVVLQQYASSYHQGPGSLRIPRSGDKKKHTLGAPSQRAR